jgi:uncharacterized protein
VSHPKQVHMFKNLIYALEKHGHEYFVIVNDKEITSCLLDKFNIKYRRIGKNKARIVNKIFQLVALTIRTIIISINFKPDIFVGQAIPHFAFVSYLLRKNFIIFEDTESSKHLQRIVNPFASAIITPKSYRENDNHQIRINGGFELAYLHPNCFTPSLEVLENLGVSIDEKFVIIRFVSWNANHDVGHNGIIEKNKILAVKEFSKFAKVFISSEGTLPAELESYRFSLSPNRMHDALHYCSLVYGESASMAAEAAYLGTPSIYLDDVGRGYTDILERDYNLVYNFSESNDDQLLSIDKGIEILIKLDPELWKNNHQNLIKDIIDVNSFMYWFIINYPESHKIMIDNPDYQNRFM